MAWCITRYAGSMACAYVVVFATLMLALRGAPLADHDFEQEEMELKAPASGPQEAEPRT